jgi:hypothetical protein
MHRNVKQSSTFYLFVVGFLLGGVLDPEEGGDTLPRKVGDLVPNDAALITQKIVLFNPKHFNKHRTRSSQ